MSSLICVLEEMSLEMLYNLDDLVVSKLKELLVDILYNVDDLVFICLKRKAAVVEERCRRN